MTQQQKDNLVYAFLYINRDKDLLVHEIQESLNNKLSDHELDVTLEGLCDLGIVSFVPATDSDGAAIPFLRYRLSAYGLSIFDKLKAKLNSGEHPEIKTTKALEITHTNIISEKDNKPPANPYPIIFKNGYAYQLFLELKEETVKDRTEVADYAFIYHKLKNKTFYAINSIVTQPAFIKFLNENFHARITVNILPIKTPARKEEVYKKLFNKYKNGILKDV
ncbi:MAG: hypothetical protein KA450_01365 [Bacteroidia bacterium]|nr:hypothetical protein [Bacteroidota bacterium]MBP6412066.1 hypothetical protein [Bacteroidia bacterium]